MATLNIDVYGPAADDYRGCGKAWIAIGDNAVVAIRYMDRLQDRENGERSAPEMDGCPAWVLAILATEHAWWDGRDICGVRGGQRLAAIARAADSAPDCPRPPRRERYRPSELLKLASQLLRAIDAALFGAYRERMRAELSALGEVRSCMISCWQAVIGA